MRVPEFLMAVSAAIRSLINRSYCVANHDRLRRYTGLAQRSLFVTCYLKPFMIAKLLLNLNRDAGTSSSASMSASVGCSS